MRYFSIIALIIILAGCNRTEDEQAAALMATIDSLYAEGKYCETLDSIMSLRTTYPKALQSRKKALRIWRDASLKLAQSDIAKTDTELQKTLRAIDSETNLYKANMLRVKRDSLQARYEAMCGVVKMIHIRQKEK